MKRESKSGQVVSLAARREATQGGAPVEAVAGGAAPRGEAASHPSLAEAADGAAPRGEAARHPSSAEAAGGAAPRDEAASQESPAEAAAGAEAPRGGAETGDSALAGAAAGSKPGRGAAAREEAAIIEQRVREGLPIAEHVARRMAHKLGGVIPADELYALAQPALLEAVRGYDPARSPLAPYLVIKLRWAMLEEARKVWRKRRAAARVAACHSLERVAEAADEEDTPAPAPATEAEDQGRLARFLGRRAAAMAVGLCSGRDAEQQTDEGESAEELMAREELRRALRNAIAALPERHRALVERHYFAGESFDAIAADLGVSKSWASRLHAQAMGSLAEAVRPLV